MKRNLFLVIGFFALTITVGESCKNKKDKTSTEQTPRTTTPVEISTDDQLRTSVNSVIRDYNEVTADINDGVVTLRGSIRQDDLQKLIMRIQELKPKRVENQLVIK